MTIVSEVAVSEDTKELETTDINEAAVLRTLKFRMVDLRTRTDRTRRGKREQTVFVFRGAGIQDARLEFANREVECNAYDLLANYRTLKSLSHNKISPKDRQFRPGEDDEDDDD